MQITNGVTGIVDKVQTLLVYWEKKYKHMWDQDKDAYIRYQTWLQLASIIRYVPQLSADIFCRTELALPSRMHYTL